MLSLLVNWRYLALIGSIPSLLLAIGTTMLPETPRFLVAQHRSKEAIDTLE